MRRVCLDTAAPAAKTAAVNLPSTGTIQAVAIFARFADEEPAAVPDPKPRVPALDLTTWVD